MICFYSYYVYYTTQSARDNISADVLEKKQKEFAKILPQFEVLRTSDSPFSVVGLLGVKFIKGLKWGVIKQELSSHNERINNFSSKVRCVIDPKTKLTSCPEKTGKSETVQQGGAEKSESLTFEEEKFYEYYGSDDNCTTTNTDKICASTEEFKALCEKATAFTVNVRKTAAVLSFGEEGAFVRSGGAFRGKGITWNEGYCWAFFDIHGILNGSSTTKDFGGKVRSIYVNSSGIPMVHYIGQ